MAANPALRSDFARAYGPPDRLVDSNDAVELDNLLGGKRQGGTLSGGNAPIWDKLGSARLRWLTPTRGAQRWGLTLLLVLLGSYFSTCPVSRRNIGGGYPTRQLFISLAAFLITLPSVRGHVHPKRRVMQVMTALAGLGIAMCGVFGAADEIHIETQWSSWLWYWHHDGLAFGYLGRLLMIILGLYLQKLARVHSIPRMLATFLLCFAWIYADAPMTIIDLARGREHW